MVPQRSPPASLGKWLEGAQGWWAGLAGCAWWQVLPGLRGPACLPPSLCVHPSHHAPIPTPRPSEANTSLVEGCFCPEATSYAPGYDVCVELCGTLPAHTAPPKPTPVLRHQDSANRTAFLSLPRLCGT